MVQVGRKEEHGAQAPSLSRESPHPRSALFEGEQSWGQPPMPSLHLEKRVESQWSKGQRDWRGVGGRGQRGHRK